MEKIIYYIILASFVSLIACNSCAYKNDEEKYQQVTLVLDWVPNTNHTGFFVAKELGYFEEAGLHVNIIQPPEGGAYGLIAAGKGDFGLSYQDEVTQFESSDNPQAIKAIAAILQHNTSGFASLSKQEIKTPKDFEGKRYGAYGSPVEEAVIRAMMKKEAADFGKVEMINVGYTDFFSIIETNKIDFKWIYYAWDGIQAEERNVGINFIKMGDYDKRLDYYTPLIIANEKLLQEKPGMVKSFLQASEKGFKYCISHPDEAVRILIKNNLDLKDRKDFLVKSQHYLAEYYLTENGIWGVMEEKRWDEYTDFLYEYKIIDKKVVAKEMFTIDFLTKNESIHK